MPRICLVALIGLPATGKTFMSRWLLENDETKLCHVIHFCYDKYLYKTTDSVDFEGKYKEKRQKILELLGQICNCIENSEGLEKFSDFLAVKMTSSNVDKYLVICDDNHYYRSMRYKLYQFCRSKLYAFGQIFIKAPLLTSLNRNASRLGPEKVPELVISRMKERLEEPSATDYPFESMTLQMQGDIELEKSRSLILEFLLKAFENIPRASHSIAISQTTQSLKHELDLLLRRRISEAMRNNHPKDPNKAARLNEKRKTILQNFQEDGNQNNSTFEFYLEMLEVT